MPERAKKIIERMNINAYDLAQTVENLLDFAVADAMAESSADEQIRPHELIVEIAPALEAANKSKGLDVRFDLDSAPVVFRGRRRPIKSILLNLALNAIKFTSHGTATISMRGVVSDALGRSLELKVSDTGPGIDAARLQQAFKRCTQLSTSSDRLHRGLGLGLAVVERNVNALGGTILVDSGADIGSTFTVTLPIRPATSA